MSEDTWQAVEQALGDLRAACSEAGWRVQAEDFVTKVAYCEMVTERYCDFQAALDKAVWEAA